MSDIKYEGTSTQFVEMQCGDPDRSENRELINLFGGEDCIKKEWTFDEIKNIFVKNGYIKNTESFFGKRKLRRFLKRGYQCNYYEMYHFYKKSNGKYSMVYDDVSGIPPG